MIFFVKRNPMQYKTYYTHREYKMIYNIWKKYYFESSLDMLRW